MSTKGARLVPFCLVALTSQARPLNTREAVNGLLSNACRSSVACRYLEITRAYFAMFKVLDGVSRSKHSSFDCTKEVPTAHLR